MRRVVVITGTPGTGKTTLSQDLLKSIGNSVVISANSVVRSRHLFSGRDRDGAMLVNIKGLQRELEKRIRVSGNKTVILEGHLLCEIKIRGAVALVLRSHLKPLEKRLRARKYKGSKLMDNLVSEALDYCGTIAEKNYTKVFEIIGTERQMLGQAMSIISGKKVKQKQIELSEELVSLLSKAQ